MNAAQHKITSLLTNFFLLISFHLCLRVYLMCGPETPKGWTPHFKPSSNEFQRMAEHSEEPEGVAGRSALRGTFTETRLGLS